MIFEDGDLAMDEDASMLEIMEKVYRSLNEDTSGSKTDERGDEPTTLEIMERVYRALHGDADEPKTDEH